MGGISGVEDEPALGPHELGPAIVDVGGCVKTDAGMAVLLVVPPEEPLAEAVGIFERPEPGREARPVLEGAEL